VILASVSNNATLSIVMLSTAVTGVNAVCVGVRGSLHHHHHVPEGLGVFPVP